MNCHGGHLGTAEASRHRRHYSAQYVQLARVLRDKIESGEYCRGGILPAADLAHEYNVSIRVTYCALALLAANRYVSRPGAVTSYSVTWQAGT
jgi:DNA-binding GntR family transcriptional regulator